MNYEGKNKADAIRSDMMVDEKDDYDDYEEEDLDFDSSNYEQEEKEKEESSKSNQNRDEFKKMIIKFMIIVVVIVLVLLLFLKIISSFSTKKYTTEEVEGIMKTAAESYFKDYPYNLPQENNQTVEISVDNLVAAKKMNSLRDYFGKNVNCTGTVQVTKIGSSYSYSPYLICDNQSSTKKLAASLTADNNIVTSGYGLYRMGNDYVYRGEKVNNYVQLENELWRIVKVNSDNTILLTLANLTSVGYPYDDRYNSEKDYDSGINSYEASRVKEMLDSMYSQKQDEQMKAIFSENDKARLVPFELCVGKMSTKDNAHNNSLECSKKLSTKIGLLTVSDFMNASIDSGCTSLTSRSCKNYNYLTDYYSYWLVTANSENSYTAFAVSDNIVSAAETNKYYRIRPVVTLSSSVVATAGDGSESNPYTVR